MPRPSSGARRAPGPLPLLVLLLAPFAPPAARTQIPDRFTNLKVLPREIAKPDLVRTMRGFASALGVRCEHCHAYRAGVDPASAQFTDLDFPSDAREAKGKARAMIQMVRAINDDWLAKLPGGATIEVRCVTCHHGVAEPEPIDEKLERTLVLDGVEAAAEEYRELRAEYHGSGAYDFDQGPLNALGERLLEKGEAASAKALLALNAEFHPDAPWTRYLLAEALLAIGDEEGAKAAFARSLELDPENPRARKRLEELSAPAPEPKPEG
jgi:hypothetical protein